jgi:hypothetical protein
MKAFIIDIFRQLMGWTKPREGKIFPTDHTRQKMREYGLDIATLEDVFRHGVRKKHKIVRRYTNSTVGLYFKTVKRKGIHSENRYLITTCWKNKRYI